MRGAAPRASRGAEAFKGEGRVRPLVSFASVASGAGKKVREKVGEEKEKEGKEKEKGKEKKRVAKGRELEDFMDELLGKSIAMKLQGGEAIAGRLLETSRFWVKVEDASGDVVYVNKAFITTIHPLGKKS